jgi:hypothetical protein
MHVTDINEMREWSPFSEEALRIARLPGFVTLLFTACLLQQVAVRRSEISAGPLIITIPRTCSQVLADPGRLCRFQLNHEPWPGGL